MIEVRLLGTLDVRVRGGGSGGTLDLTQAKRLAVLAYLAAPPRRVHRRDTLLALFWPELDTERARGALRKALHHIRAAFGDDVVVGRGNETLELDGETVWCDAVAFEEALTAGDLSGALELYGGDLLAGVFVSDAPAFERWIDAERTRLRRRAADAVATLAHAADRAGDAAASAHWARRALAIEPDDERVLRRLIDALDRNGDRAGAIEAYEQFARTLAADHDEPSSETKTHVDRVRGGRRQTGAPASSTAPAGLERGAPPASRAPSADAPAPDGSVAVLDFTNLSGDDAYGWLAAGIAETVSADLGKISQLAVAGRDRVARAVAARGATLDAADDDGAAALGRSLGVRWVVRGSYQKSGDRLRLTPRFVDAVTGRVQSAKIDGAMSEVFTLQDRVVAAFADVLQLPLSVDERRRIARSETRAIPAYECFAKGRRLFNEFGKSAFAEAAQWFARALELDPTYALAYSGLGSIHAFRYIARAHRADLDIALSHLQRALDLDPDLVEPHAWLAYAYGRADRFDEATSAGARAVEVEPANPLAHYFHASAEVMRGARRYEPEAYAAAVPKLLRALELDPTMVAAQLQLGWLYIVNGDYARAREALDAAVAVELAGRYQEVRFPGGLLLRGALHVRENQLEEGRSLLVRAIERYAGTDHVYAEAFTALAHCWLGEIAVRTAMHDEALAAFDRALALAVANPEKLGIGHVIVRARVGLATAFHALRMRRDEARELSAAMTLLERKPDFDFGWIWEANDGSALHEFARYYSRAGRPGEVAACLRRAVACAWSDGTALQLDPCFARYTGHLEIEAVRGTLLAQRERFDSAVSAAMLCHAGVES
jgi:DNA-binding SARP family transcriptional activator/TolB-like protein